MSFGFSHRRPLDTTGFGLTRDDLPAFDAIDRDRARIDGRDWFDHPQRRFEIEIGCGKGTFLVQQASAHPEVNYLGIEQAGEFFCFAADRMRRRSLANVRILHADAAEFLRFHCISDVADVIHLYFSDPWPKKRHHKRRVVQDDSLREMHRVLRPAGELRLVTDHEDLWAWYEDHARRNADLFDRREFQSRQLTDDDGELVGTNYERKFAQEGRAFHAMTLVKRR